MKQAIVDRNPSVASAALVSAMVSIMEHYHVHEYHASPQRIQSILNKGGNEVVKRWMNEAQEAVSSDNIMVQVWSKISKQLTVILPYHSIMHLVSCTICVNMID